MALQFIDNRRQRSEEKYIGQVCCVSVCEFTEVCWFIQSVYGGMVEHIVVGNMLLLTGREIRLMLLTTSSNKWKINMK